EVLDVGIGDVVAERRQPAVKGELIGRVLGEGHPAVVARRQDVARDIAPLVMTAVLPRSPFCSDKGQEQEQDGGGQDDGQASPAPKASCPKGLVPIPSAPHEALSLPPGEARLETPGPRIGFESASRRARLRLSTPSPATSRSPIR